MSHEKDAGKEPPKRKNKLEQLAGEKPPQAAAILPKKNKADAVLGTQPRADQQQPSTSNNVDSQTIDAGNATKGKKNMGKILGAEFAATSAANLGEKRERSPRSQADIPQISKLARLGTPESATKTSEDSPISKQERMLGDTNTETFVDPNYRESKSTINLASLAIGRMICSVILTGRQTISPETFKHNLNMEAGNAKHNPLTLITEDGAKVSGLKIEANPASDKTIIVFQGQKGNFQDQKQLQRLFEIARETGANVVAFNYREKPSSKQDFINDAIAATNYVTSRMGVQDHNNITLYGESFGGTVAAETALQLKTNSEKEVNVFLSRTPKSLSDAVKMLDLEALLKKPAIKFLQEVTTKIGETRFIKSILDKGINGDFEAQEALNKLDPKKVKCARVEGDPIIHKEANVEHKNMTVYTTREDDKHNAPLSQLSQVSEKPTKWVRAGQNATQERQNGFDLLREHANPGFKREQRTAAAPKK